MKWPLTEVQYKLENRKEDDGSHYTTNNSGEGVAARIGIAVALRELGIAPASHAGAE